MSYRDVYEKWLSSSALSEAEKEELRSISGDEKEIESRFFAPLEFGTAGLRGIMAVGLHNMNIHVIRWATQGFAQVICAEGEEGKRRGVAICMDCRNHSMEFARAAAEVCAANGIHVRIFESLRPTPELSFAVREYRCQAGINVTASHNPKEYNGYKVYWEDGAQLPPHHADAIAAALEQIDVFNGIRRMDFDEAVKAGLIADEALFELFEEGDVERDIEEILCRALVVKKNVVEQDERDKNVRACLNFGHTLGHAIESASGMDLLHGECVALGMLPMIDDKALRKRTIALYKKLGLPASIRYDGEKVGAFLAHDKKLGAGGKVTLVRVGELGSYYLEKAPLADVRALVGSGIR